jgi:tRNA (Thr-GGU) A37 N-methylase
MTDMTVRPVGVVRNDIKNPSLVAHSGDLNWEGESPTTSNHAEKVSEIVIHQDYAGIIDGIEEFSHLLVLYWADRVSEVG